MTTLYLAASTVDMDRARHWCERLRSAGVNVVSTWLEAVTAAGDANPPDAAKEARAGWARTCLAELSTADLLWLLVPPVGRETRGAWVELGYAISCSIDIIASGGTAQSIFCALGEEHANDESAFAAVRAKCSTPMSAALASS